MQPLGKTYRALSGSGSRRRNRGNCDTAHHFALCAPGSSGGYLAGGA